MHTFLKKIIQDMNNGLFTGIIIISILNIIIQSLSKELLFLFRGSFFGILSYVVLATVFLNVVISFFAKRKYDSKFPVNAFQSIETVCMPISLLLSFLLIIFQLYPYNSALDDKIIEIVYILFLIGFFTVSALRRLQGRRRRLFGFSVITCQLLFAFFMNLSYSMKNQNTFFFLNFALFMSVCGYLICNASLPYGKSSEPKDNVWTISAWIVSTTCSTWYIFQSDRLLELWPIFLTVAFEFCLFSAFLGYYLGEHILHKGRIEPQKVWYWRIAAVAIPLVPVILSTRFWKLIASALV